MADEPQSHQPDNDQIEKDSSSEEISSPDNINPVELPPQASEEEVTLHQQLTAALHALDVLNAQLGVAGAILVNHYHLQRQRETITAQPQPNYGGGYQQSYQPYPQQYPPQPGQPPIPQTPYPQQYQPPYPGQLQQINPAPMPQNQYPPNPQQPPQGPPPLSQDLASLANILTQIQYDLFDISVQLAQPSEPGNHFNSRLDDKAISWVKDLISKINTQLPAHQDPILPVGNQLACEFYMAKTYTQAAHTNISLFYERNPSYQPDNVEIITDYLYQLITLTFVIFRWANLVMGEKEWFWKPKDEMPQQQPAQPQPNAPAPNGLAHQPNGPSNLPVK